MQAYRTFFPVDNRGGFARRTYVKAPPSASLALCSTALIR